MIKKTMTYTDFDGNERTEDFYFNFTQAEILEMEMGINGGLQQKLLAIVASKNQPEIIEYFKKIVLEAFGKKTPDGRGFVKRSEYSEEFASTEAYSDLFMELAFDAEAAAAFVNGIMPKQINNASRIPAPQN